LSIKAVTFDFWNTLFTEAPGAFQLYKERRRSWLTEMISEGICVAHDDLERACKAEAQSHHQIWREEHRTVAAIERLSCILNHINISLPQAALTELATRFEEGILEHPPILVDGAREVLARLAERYRLGIISDVGFSPGRILKRVLDNSGLLGFFDSLIFSDEAGCSKPHREVFECSTKSLSIEPNQIVHVGDLEYTDIVGAKRAGYRAIRFTGVTPIEEGETTIADFVTDDLTNVPRLVGMLD
jgi:putative hydrolase of the HAD superfamily